MIDAALAKSIRLVAFDVDGVMTDGGIYLGDVDGRRLEFKRYEIQDGLGIAMLRLDASGRPDRTFGHGDRVQTAAVPDTEGFRVRDVVVDSLGRTTVVGVSGDGAGKATILTRYLP